MCISAGCPLCCDVGKTWTVSVPSCTTRQLAKRCNCVWLWPVLCTAPAEAQSSVMVLDVWTTWPRRQRGWWQQVGNSIIFHNLLDFKLRHYSGIEMCVLLYYCYYYLTRSVLVMDTGIVQPAWSMWFPSLRSLLGSRKVKASWSQCMECPLVLWTVASVTGRPSRRHLTHCQEGHLACEKPAPVMSKCSILEEWPKLQ